jgi:hypothetical protein
MRFYESRGFAQFAHQSFAASAFCRKCHAKSSPLLRHEYLKPLGFSRSIPLATRAAQSYRTVQLLYTQRHRFRPCT